MPRDVVDLLTPLYQAIGGRLYRLHILQNAAAIQMGDGMDLESRLVMMQREISRNTTTRFVGNIGQRDALTGLTPGDICHVTDASADPLVISGSAAYIWLPTLEWKLAYRGNSPLDLENFLNPNGSLALAEGKLGVNVAWLLATLAGEGLTASDGKLALDLAWLLAPDVLGQLAAALLKPGAGLGLEDGKLVLDTANMETAMFNKLLASLHLPKWISANLDLYVNGTSGADGPNRGAETAPYKTIQAACDYLCDNIHAGNHTVTIHVAPGVYEESIGLHEFNRSAGRAILRAEGGVTLKNRTASQAYVINAEGGVWTLEGFTLAMNIASAADDVRHAIYCNGADLTLRNITSGVSQTASAILASPLLVNAGVARIMEGCQLTGAHSGSDSNNIHAMFAQNGGRLALVANLTVSGAFNVVAHAANRGMLERSPITMPTVTGTATGKRYSADTGGSIQTLAGGDDYFPGSIAGTCDADTFSWYK